MKTNGKVKNFFKRYGYYCLAGILTVAIASTIALSVPKSEQQPVENVPTQSTTVTFGLPLSDFTVLKGYSSEDLQYNATMNQWEAHKAVDLTSENLAVYSVLDGTITSLETTYEDGTRIVIAHENGFKSVYSSLSENTKVNVGDKVKKGQQLGEISNSASQESKDGAHLHFELLKDDVKVDPSNYIAIENK